MHLDSQTHCCEQPAVIFVTAHPATVEVKNILYDTLHRLNFICSFTVNLFMFLLRHEFDHLFAMRRFIHVLPTVSNQIHFTLSFEPKIGLGVAMIIATFVVSALGALIVQAPSLDVSVVWGLNNQST